MQSGIRGNSESNSSFPNGSHGVERWWRGVLILGVTQDIQSNSSAAV